LWSFSRLVCVFIVWCFVCSSFSFVFHELYLKNNSKDCSCVSSSRKRQLLQTMLAAPPSKCTKLTWVPGASLPYGNSQLSTPDHYLNENNVQNERDDDEVNTQLADDMLALLAKVAGEVDYQPHKPLHSILKNPFDTARSRDLQLGTQGSSNSPGVFLTSFSPYSCGCQHSSGYIDTGLIIRMLTENKHHFGNATPHETDPCPLCPHTHTF